MFELNESISNIVADKNRIIEIFRSVNDSQVQIPGFDSQNSSSFVVSLTENGEIKIYIFLFLKESLKGIVYTTDEKIKKNNYVDMRNDAIFFLESMGFMLENMDFRKLPDEEKDRIIKTLPLFVADLSQLAEDKKGEEENDPGDESDEAEIVVEEREEEKMSFYPTKTKKSNFVG